MWLFFEKFFRGPWQTSVTSKVSKIPPSFNQQHHKHPHNWPKTRSTTGFSAMAGFPHLAGRFTRLEVLAAVCHIGRVVEGLAASAPYHKPHYLGDHNDYHQRQA